MNTNIKLIAKLSLLSYAIIGWDGVLSACDNSEMAMASSRSALSDSQELKMAKLKISNLQTLLYDQSMLIDNAQAKHLTPLQRKLTRVKKELFATKAHEAQMEAQIKALQEQNDSLDKQLRRYKGELFDSRAREAAKDIEIASLESRVAQLLEKINAGIPPRADEEPNDSEPMVL